MFASLSMSISSIKCSIVAVLVRSNDSLHLLHLLVDVLIGRGGGEGDEERVAY